MSKTSAGKRKSGPCESYIMYHPQLSPRAKLVYAVLSTFADREGKVWVSHTQLQQIVGAATTRHVSDWIEELVGVGAVSAHAHYVAKGETTYMAGYTYSVHRDAVHGMYTYQREFHKEEIPLGAKRPIPKPPPKVAQYGIIPHAVLESEALSWQAKLLYVWHATQADRETNQTYTSTKTMAAALRISRGRYTDYLQQLVDAGFLDYVSALELESKPMAGRRRNVNLYLLKPDLPAEDPRRDGAPPRREGAYPRRQGAPPPDDREHPPRRQGAPPPTTGSTPPDDREHNQSSLSEYISIGSDQISLSDFEAKELTESAIRQVPDNPFTSFKSRLQKHRAEHAESVRQASAALGEQSNVELKSPTQNGTINE